MSCRRLCHVKHRPGLPASSATRAARWCRSTTSRQRDPQSVRGSDQRHAQRARRNDEWWQHRAAIGYRHLGSAAIVQSSRPGSYRRRVGIQPDSRRGRRSGARQRDGRTHRGGRWQPDFFLRCRRREFRRGDQAQHDPNLSQQPGAAALVPSGDAVIADRVKELSTTTGTGAFALTGAVTGFEGFNTAFGVGPAFDYCIESIDDTIGAPNGSWEIGTGHLSGATTLVRATVRQSSNADALVAFAAGTKNVFCTLPASVIIALQAKLDDAPSDGKTYGRKDAVWAEAAGISALNAKEDKASKGIANGYASLDASTKVPAAQLPSYVDDVLEFANLAAFPATGATGIIYVALDTGKIYRWSGSAYVEISPSPGSSDAVPEGSVNLYYTNARASAAAPVQSVAGRTGTVTLTKSDVGLANVDNTSDASKPVSTATQAGLDGKVAKAGDTMTGNLIVSKDNPRLIVDRTTAANAELVGT